MKPWSSLLSPRAVALVCAAALSRGAVADESGAPMELGSILGFELGSARMQQLIQEKSEEAARTGEWRKGMEALSLIAQAAKEGGDRSASLDAEIAWVKLAAREGDLDLDEVLDKLVLRARDWDLARQESEVFVLWAGYLEEEGQWLMALRAMDAAAQAALGDGLVNRALRAMLGMSRLCRENNHPWRLQQVWVRIAQVEEELGIQIDRPVREILEDERIASAPLLAGLPEQAVVPAAVDLQPSRAAVRVSAPHSEVGRTRFVLTNETVRTVRGTLKVESATGTVKKWDAARTGHWLILGPPGAPAAAPTAEGDAGPPGPAEASSATRALALRPGERLSVYVEREQPGAKDTVNLLWSGPSGDLLASGDFAFAAREPESSITNGGRYAARAGWNQPVYHEFNFRGDGVRTEDFQFFASVPCRLEVFDLDGGRFPLVDAGELLAVDAEGDGCFTGPDDVVAGDLNADGNPDLLIGDRSRSVEVYAWPLVPLPPGEEVTISASLREPAPAEAGSWRKVAEDLLGPARPLPDNP